MNKTSIVTLTAEERTSVEDLLRKGSAAARKLTPARILLKADGGPGGPGWPDAQISTALEVSTGTAQRIRQLFVEEGLQAALSPRPSRRVWEYKLDGTGAAHLIALACSAPPAGQARWTLRLLAEKMVDRA